MATRDAPEGSGYTQCPSCLTVFRASPSALRVADGRARCGLCGTVFHAAARWRARLPRASTEVAAPDQPQPDGPATSERDAAPTQARESVEAGADTASAATGTPARGKAPRGQARRDRGGGGSGKSVPGWRIATDADVEGAVAGRHWPWLLAAGLLIVILVLQLAWFQRERLAAYPSAYPWVAAACRYLPCAVEPPYQPGAVAVVERVLRPHPERDEAMVLAATIVNQANRPQPWPQLGLRLSALNGKIIASHWFAPQRYRGREASGDAHMTPNTEYALRVIFRRPEREVAGFEMDFR